VSLSGCRSEPSLPDLGGAKWSWVAHSEAASLMSVHGTGRDDVWVVGADDGKGGVVLHWDGRTWNRLDAGVRADLWWVNATEDGPVYFAGSNATFLRYDNGSFERLHPPGLGKHTVFGVWAAGSNDVYAVGSAAGKNGFIWYYDGHDVRDVPLPAELPEDQGGEVPGLFKVWGLSPRDVWVVGGNGVVLRGNASDGFKTVKAGGNDIYFTVYGSGDEVVVVGGSTGGVLLEGAGDPLIDRTPPSAPLLQGAFVEASGRIWAVGQGGRIYTGNRESLRPVETGLELAPSESLHAVWVDPEGGVWAVGGNVLTPDLDRGVAMHSGVDVPEIRLVPDPPAPPSCPEDAVDPKPDGSIARRWNEQILNAIRRDVPRPGVHARNLFHLSAALWDAWSAYDATAVGYVVRERASADDVDAARREAISYAAYRVLSHRYAKAVGGAVSQACFDAFMGRLGYDVTDANDVGASPRAVGNRIASSVIRRFADDGANEEANYADAENFEPDTPFLVVDRPGTTATDPTLWQRLVLAKAETQNGIPAGAGAQLYLGGQWGTVTSFALSRPAPNEPYLDIGHAPSALGGAAVESIRRSAELDVDDPTIIDISPGAVGMNPLGTNDGGGYPLNPKTGQAYQPEKVLRSDFGRVLAEFWADGPTSETPPGHWNTIANSVSEHPELERRLFGEGARLDALSWDVHVYLALNGAVHDAAIAAWELKRKYVAARPITLVRYMGGHGQRSDPNAASYSPEGLPLVDGLIEVISLDSSAAGQRHAHLARHVGEIAVRSWRGEPGDRKSEIGGVGWIRAVDWMPYQRRTFVTPAFPGYVSGHSTFSRAAAVVLAGITGSEFFPGGYGSYAFEPGYLFFERGPTAPLRLGWATYFDAADQAGQSRIWGGIHVAEDDFDGRRIGARVGASALEVARRYFDGSISANK
jgi:hypothetical protein